MDGHCLTFPIIKPNQGKIQGIRILASRKGSVTGRATASRVNCVHLVNNNGKVYDYTCQKQIEPELVNIFCIFFINIFLSNLFAQFSHS